MFCFTGEEPGGGGGAERPRLSDRARTRLQIPSTGLQVCAPLPHTHMIILSSLSSSGLFY